MDEVEQVLISVVTTALDNNGWSFLRPVMSDGSLGTQIDSTDVAQLVTKYLLMFQEEGG